MFYDEAWHLIALKELLILEATIPEGWATDSLIERWFFFYFNVSSSIYMCYMTDHVDAVLNVMGEKKSWLALCNLEDRARITLSYFPFLGYYYKNT